MNNKLIRLTEQNLHRIVKESVDKVLIEASRQDKEKMLVDLYNYLAKDPTDDIYDANGGLNTSYKAYNYFIPKGIVHNAWCIHFTNMEAYESIKSRGFRIGVPDYDALAYSSQYYDKDSHNKSGWNFALPIDNKYLGDDFGYGDCGLIIKTDGVRAYHKGDHDDEIIFKGCMVKKKIPFSYEYECHGWILNGNYYQRCELPNDVYYHEDFNCLVFKDVKSLIQFVITK